MSSTFPYDILMDVEVTEGLQTNDPLGRIKTECIDGQGWDIQKSSNGQGWEIKKSSNVAVA